MAEQVTIGDPPIAVRIRRSARARRFSLRISAADGGVSLTLPKRARLTEAVAFARTKEAWLRGHIAARPAEVLPTAGAMFPFEGRKLQLQPGSGRQVICTQDAILMPGAEAHWPGRLRGFLQARARDRLTAASDTYAAKLGLSFDRITLRDTRSRWGSCTSDGRLMYSWRLIMAPPDVLDYVAAHEVCHLREMHHGSAFWDLVAQVSPGFAGPRDWLRVNGPDLHRYRFQTPAD